LIRPAVQLGPFSGINNVSDKRALKTTDEKNEVLTELQTATNIDLDNSGFSFRRAGILRVATGAIHSVFAYGAYGYYVKASVLYRINSAYSPTAIANLRNNAAMKYTVINKDIYATNNADFIGIRDGEIITFPTISEKFKSAMYPGTIIATYRGRIYTARGSWLYYSDSMAYHRRDTRDCRIWFPDRITMVRPVDSGIFISSDKVCFLDGGEPSDFKKKDVSEDRAMENTDISFDSVAYIEKGVTGTSCSWMSEKGWHIGLPDGSVINKTLSKYEPQGTSGAACVIRENSRNFDQYIAVINN
jgi:hypothetical protein